MHRKFRNLALALVFFLAGSNDLYAALTLGAGSEYFVWQEYGSGGGRLLKETGFRGVLELEWQKEAASGLLPGYAGKIYLGNVNYDGQTLVAPIVQVTTNTSYTGIQNELFLAFRTPLTRSDSLDILSSAGWDHWSRDINPQSVSQVEDYDIFYVRLGPSWRHRLPGMTAYLTLGGKIPFYTNENAHINTICLNESQIDPRFLNCVNMNPPLHPGEEISLFGTAGLELTPAWSLVLYYDSFRFSESSAETETGMGFHQPRSTMDLYGLKALFRFR
jgi:hypothetical protein